MPHTMPTYDTKLERLIFSQHVDAIKWISHSKIQIVISLGRPKFGDYPVARGPHVEKHVEIIWKPKIVITYHDTMHVPSTLPDA